MRWSTNRSCGPPSAKSKRAWQCFSQRRVSRLDEHLPAHPEVHDEGVLAVEGEPEVLPATRGRGDGHVVQPGGEVVGTGVVAAGDARRPRDPGASDVAADDVVGEAAADDLDLGQLRHGGRVRRLEPSASRLGARLAAVGRRRRAPCASRERCQASLAAFCSASFFERPGPSPRTSSPTTTPGVELLLVVGPLLARRGTRATPSAEPAAISCRLVFQSRPAPSVAASLDAAGRSGGARSARRRRCRSTGRPCR